MPDGPAPTCARYREPVRRRQTPPREVKNALALRPHERILAAARTATEEWVVATDRRLYLPEPGGADTYQGIPWEQVEHAEWDREEEILRVTAAAPLGQPMPTWRLRFDPPDQRLLALIRERITASVVTERHIPLRGRLGVRVIARRPPAGDPDAADGGIVWALAFDEGLDPNDPDVLDAAHRALATVRAEIEP